jgi:hypothetical protein
MAGDKSGRIWNKDITEQTREEHLYEEDAEIFREAET